MKVLPQHPSVRHTGLLAVLLSSVFLVDCRNDCRPLRTTEGERLKVTIVSKRKICGQAPLQTGDVFLIDMGTTYREDSAENCIGRIGKVSSLPEALSEVLDVCNEGDGFGTYVKCFGKAQDSQCSADAFVWFPAPPELGMTASKGTVEVWWSSSCWPRNCDGDLRDSYDATIERVGMGWVPPAE